MADRHRTLRQVLFVVLAVVLANTALTIYELVRFNQRVDSEVCRILARVPGHVQNLEREIKCPVTEPVVLPQPTATVTSPGPTATSTVPAPHRTGTAAGPAPTPSPSAHGAGPALPRASAARPIAEPTPSPSPRPSPTPTSSPLLCQILNPLIGVCP